MFNRTRSMVKRAKSRITNLPNYIRTHKFEIVQATGRTIFKILVAITVGLIVTAAFAFMGIPTEPASVGGKVTIVLVFLLLMRGQIRRYRLRKEARRRLQLEESAEKYVKPSLVTAEHSSLSRDELATVRYDGPQSWVVWFVLFTNPGWQPQETDHSDNGVGAAEKTVNRFIKIVGRLFGLTLAILPWVAAAGTIGIFLVHGDPEKLASLQISDVFKHRLTWIGIDLLVLSLVIIWGRYINRLRQRNRFIVTDRSLVLLIMQRPWKDMLRPIVPMDTFTQHTYRQSIIGKLFGFAHFYIKSTEETEQIKVRMYCRDPELLDAILNRQREINQQKTRDGTGSHQRQNPASRFA